MRLSAAFAFIGVILPAFGTENLPIPRFTDAARKSKLEAAFPEIEKIFEKFYQQKGVPGMVFGVVIDGEKLAPGAALFSPTD